MGDRTPEGIFSGDQLAFYTEIPTAKYEKGRERWRKRSQDVIPRGRAKARAEVHRRAGLRINTQELARGPPHPGANVLSAASTRHCTYACLYI